MVGKTAPGSSLLQDEAESSYSVNPPVSKYLNIPNLINYFYDAVTSMSLYLPKTLHVMKKGLEFEEIALCEFTTSKFQRTTNIDSFLEFVCSYYMKYPMTEQKRTNQLPLMVQ